jgi:alpha-L-rhamnosidase
VAGIRQKPGSVGWKQVVIAPNPGPLSYAEATLATPAGHILSRWRIQDGTFRLEVEIPEGVIATAILPSGSSKSLQAGMQEVTEPWKQPST